MRFRLWILAVTAAHLACTGWFNDRAESPEGQKLSCLPGTPPSTAMTPARRLTRVEYINSVRDLLEIDPSIVGELLPDEAVGGFGSNNATPVSPVGVEHYWDAAHTLATAATWVPPCDPAVVGQSACARTFISTFGRRVFRRPLESTDVEDLYAVYAQGRVEGTFGEALQLVVEALLSSGSFLYRSELGTPSGGEARPLTGHELASRLSYFLWASTPDEALLDAAAAGALSTPEGLRAEAERLLDSERADQAVRSFYGQWLGLAELEKFSPSTQLYPQYSPELGAAMQEETLRLASYVHRGGGGNFESLLTAPYSFLNAELAALYGAPAPVGSGFVQTQLPAGQRGGLLTHASLMAATSNGVRGSPILRGKFIRNRLLCQDLPPPPPGVDTSPPVVPPGTSTRERFRIHTDNPACASCHRLMDPIGFSFTHYNALGGWMDYDGAGPVDASGEILGTSDADGPLNGALELGTKLAASTQARECFSTQWLRFALGRLEHKKDRCSLEGIVSKFNASGGSIRETLLAIVASDAFRYAAPESAEGTP